MSKHQDQPKSLREAAEEPRRVQRQRGLLSRINRQSKYYWLRVLLENNASVIGMVFVAAIVMSTIVVPNIVEHDPFRVDPRNQFLNPSWDHPFGTDNFGRDVMTRAAVGARLSLIVGLSVMVLSTLIGSVFGLIAGYYQRFDTPIMRVMDGIMAFPGLVLAIAIMATLGPAAQNVVIALTVSYIPIISRLVRGNTLSLKSFAYVEAARSIGVRDFTLLRKHIYPNAVSTVIVQATFVVAFAIIAEASLSFLGAGIHPATPTWGNMLREGQQSIAYAWWLAIFPGALLFLTVLAINLIGDGLRDALDPRSRGR